MRGNERMRGGVEKETQKNFEVEQVLDQYTCRIKYNWYFVPLGVCRIRYNCTVVPQPTVVSFFCCGDEFIEVRLVFSSFKKFIC